MKAMVLDVESIGLHGEGFWVAWVLVDLADSEFNVLESQGYFCPTDEAEGLEKNREWVRANVPDARQGEAVVDPLKVRDRFWYDWMRLKRDHGAVMFADCVWPVEAGFLAACIADDPAHREWEGPYPIHDIATVLMCAGLDPLATYPRRGDEPVHCALGDARQSARLLHASYQSLTINKETK